jgi:hypothetical protein
MINTTNNKKYKFGKEKIAIDYVIGHNDMSPCQIQFLYVFDVHANSMFTPYIYLACQEGIR